MNEKTMLSSFRAHPNIIRVFEREEKKFENYLLMEMELGKETLK